MPARTKRASVSEDGTLINQRVPRVVEVEYPPSSSEEAAETGSEAESDAGGEQYCVNRNPNPKGKGVAEETEPLKPTEMFFLTIEYNKAIKIETRCSLLKTIKTLESVLTEKSLNGFMTILSSTISSTCRSLKTTSPWACGCFFFGLCVHRRSGRLGFCSVELPSVIPSKNMESSLDCSVTTIHYPEETEMETEKEKETEMETEKEKETEGGETEKETEGGEKEKETEAEEEKEKETYMETEEKEKEKEAEEKEKEAEEKEKETGAGEKEKRITRPSTAMRTPFEAGNRRKKRKKNPALKNPTPSNEDYPSFIFLWQTVNVYLFPNWI